jgi:metal-responsive CopG/Arc/MetJ family transcriptional regulator
MGKLILNIPDDLIEELDLKVKELRLPSRTSLLIQIILKFLEHPNVFDGKK